MLYQQQQYRSGRSIRVILGSVPVILFFLFAPAASQVFTAEYRIGEQINYSIGNEQIEYTVRIDDSIIASDLLKSKDVWMQQFGGSSIEFESDAGFSIDLSQEEERSPGSLKAVHLSAQDFNVKHHRFNSYIDGKKELVIHLVGVETPVDLEITYELEPGSSHLKKRLTLSGSNSGHYTIDSIQVFDIRATTICSIVEGYDFTPYAAIRTGDGGIFFGLNDPLSNSRARADSTGTRIICSRKSGRVLTSESRKSGWGVAGMSPSLRVEKWFQEYRERSGFAPEIAK